MNKIKVHPSSSSHGSTVWAQVRLSVLTVVKSSRNVDRLITSIAVSTFCSRIWAVINPLHLMSSITIHGTLSLHRHLLLHHLRLHTISHWLLLLHHHLLLLLLLIRHLLLLGHGLSLLLSLCLSLHLHLHLLLLHSLLLHSCLLLCLSSSGL